MLFGIHNPCTPERGGCTKHRHIPVHSADDGAFIGRCVDVEAGEGWEEDAVAEGVDDACVAWVFFV